MIKSALVVIPTTGADTLADAVQSVLQQTHSDTEVWAVVDGPFFAARAQEVLARYPAVKTLQLLENTGRDGFFGHRIYAAVSYLMNSDYVFYLDQDNWYEPGHVASMVGACERHAWSWCHSLRKIHRTSGEYVCEDDCESLGAWPTYVHPDQHLVDTSTYCIRREVIVRLAPAWYGRWGADRQFYSAISTHAPKFGCTAQSTVCYRLGGNPNSVPAAFFEEGNAVMAQRYPNGFPWRKAASGIVEIGQPGRY
ncbi:MAG: glycosyltransferase [Rubritepida sp.]|nr:glycosyltransferase [Rubritepida sp.]